RLRSLNRQSEQPSIQIQPVQPILHEQIHFEPMHTGIDLPLATISVDSERHTPYGSQQIHQFRKQLARQLNSAPELIIHHYPHSSLNSNTEAATARMPRLKLQRANLMASNVSGNSVP